LGNKEKKALELRILDNSIRIVTDEDEEYVYKIVSYLNKKMEDISKSTKIASNTEKMVLVALNIADEYFKLKSAEENITYLDKDFSHMINLIDEALSS
jgi:cell division protein ZapA